MRLETVSALNWLRHLRLRYVRKVERRNLSTLQLMRLFRWRWSPTNTAACYMKL